jgi:L-alanine-DL-glutamate epimerase-like enolase superfamily enzyme
MNRRMFLGQAAMAYGAFLLHARAQGTSRAPSLTIREIQPDVSKTGGLLETRKIAAMAEVYSIPIAPHGVASPLGTMAAAHVAATTPNLMLLEFTHYVDQSYTSLAEPVLLDENGFLPVRTTPGIGVALNEDVVKERTDPEFRPL